MLCMPSVCPCLVCIHSPAYFHDRYKQRWEQKERCVSADAIHTCPQIPAAHVPVEAASEGYWLRGMANETHHRLHASTLDFLVHLLAMLYLLGKEVHTSS